MEITSNKRGNFHAEDINLEIKGSDEFLVIFLIYIFTQIPQRRGTELESGLSR